MKLCSEILLSGIKYRRYGLYVTAALLIFMITVTIVYGKFLIVLYKLKEHIKLLFGTKSPRCARSLFQWYNCLKICTNLVKNCVIVLICVISVTKYKI